MLNQKNIFNKIISFSRVTNYINRAKYYNNDGLNNLNYTVIDLKQYLLYTWILAKLDYKAEIKFENN